MFKSPAGLLAKSLLLTIALFIKAMTGFAHRVELFNSTGCASGNSVTVNAVVVAAGSGTYYNWQFKDNSGTWKFFTASSTINGSAFTVSGFQFGPAANNAGTLNIANATTALEGVQVRVLMADNVRPNGAPAGTNIWGGDDEALNEVKMFHLHVYSTPADCGGTTPGCIGNLINSASGYYGGFEDKDYDASAATFTDKNFISGAGSTDYTVAGAGSAVPGTSGTGTYQVWNNPKSVNSSNAAFAPHSGNFQMILQGAASTQKKAWFKTVGVTPNAVYNFSVWVARTQGSNAFNVKLTANGSDLISSAVSTTIGSWNKISASYTVPAGVTSMVIAISDVSSSVTRYFSLDDICFSLTTDAAAIGDRVWLDANGNGLQDASETGGISGVTVSLKNSAGTVIATDVTDGSGIYGFNGLAAGTYSVSFPLTVTGGALTTANVPSNDAIDSDPVATTGQTASITLTAGQKNLTIDAGYRPTNLSLGNRVWYDVNNNGINTNENGIAGVTVHLYKDDNNDNTADGAFIATDVTDADGYYGFSNLAPGNYIVGVVTPAGYVSSSVNGGDPDNDINLDNNGQVTVGNETRGLAITLIAGTENNGSVTTSNENVTYDFGFLPDCGCVNSASNRLINGSFENGTTGWSATGGTVTSGTGYIACGAANGFNNNGTAGTASNVFQDVALPAGSVVSLSAYLGTHTAGLSCAPTLSLIFMNASNTVLAQSNVAITRDVDVNFNQLAQYTLSGTAPNGTTKVRVQTSITCNTVKMDAFCLTAVVPNYVIGNNVWNDLDNDGIKETNEPPVAGVVVKLYDCAGTYLNKTTTTDANGVYQLTGLPAGSYIVGITTPAGYAKSDVGTTIVGTDNQNDGTTVVGTEIRTGCFAITGSTDNIDFGLKGTGSLGDFVWNDANGNGLQDAGEAGINGVTVTLTYPNGATATTTTAGNGAYSFVNLPAGTTYSVAFATPAGYTATTSNVPANDAIDSDPVGGIVTNVVVVAGTANNTVDAGFYQTVNVGNFVWYDKNNNGVQDAGEPGVGSVAVKLYADANMDNIPDGAAVATTTTNPAGIYAFAGLKPGTYIAAITLPAGYTMGFTTASSLTPDNNNTTDNNGITIIGTEVRTNFMTLTAGAEPATAVDGDGTNGNLTLDFGIRGTGVIGNFVWNDYNRNGIQDAGEPGIAGATVTLTFSDGSTLSQVTNQSGIYSFTGLTAGTYKVTFTTPTATSGTFTPTTSNAMANDLVDSDPIAGVVNGIALAAGEINNSIDAGFYRLVNVRGNVWHDANGLFDNEVNKTSNVSIPVGLNIYLVDNATGLIVQAEGIQPNGTYTFFDVPAQSVYRIVLSSIIADPGQPAPRAALPTGWRNTGENLGAGPNSGSDGIVNGLLFIEVEDADVENANFGIRTRNGEVIIG